jgi:CDP-glycerol glycerophosphotransferase (TagB/SpsB family)
MVRAEATYHTKGGLARSWSDETPIERAHSLKELDDSKEKAEQESAARARRRAEKQAAKQAAESAGVNDA